MVSELTTEERLDLALAAQLQAALLPRTCPAGCPQQNVAARNRMCGSVGGDFYDFLRINEDQTAVVVGDVVGHGIRASLLMAQIMGLLRSDRPSRGRPVEIIRELNAMLLALGEEVGDVLNCSLFYSAFDAPTGLGLFVNAGHPRPYLCDRSRGKVQTLGTHDLLLGVQEFAPTEMCHTFSPGERLVLYTDGIVDAANPAEDRFGARRLRELICAHAADDADTLARAVMDAVADFAAGAVQTDDQSIVVVDRV